MNRCHTYLAAACLVLEAPAYREGACLCPSYLRQRISPQQTTGRDQFFAWKARATAFSSLQTWRALHTRRRTARRSGRHPRRHAATHPRRRAHSCTAFKKKHRDQNQNKGAAKTQQRRSRPMPRQITRWGRSHSRRAARRRSATSHHAGRRSPATHGGRRHDTGARTTHPTRRASQP